MEKVVSQKSRGVCPSLSKRTNNFKLNEFTFFEKMEKSCCCSFCVLKYHIFHQIARGVFFYTAQHVTDNRHPVRKSPSLRSRKSNPNPKFLGAAEAYFVCHISPKFQISLIYALIGCP
jgi:hypothetical protein